MGDGWCFLLRSEGKCASAIRDKLLDNLPSARVEENTRSWGGGPLQSISAGTLCGAESGDGQVGDMNLTLEKVAWIGGSNMTIKVLVTEGVWGHPLVEKECRSLPFVLAADNQAFIIQEASLPAFLPQQLGSLPGAASTWAPSTPS